MRLWVFGCELIYLISNIYIDNQKKDFFRHKTRNKEGKRRAKIEHKCFHQSRYMLQNQTQSCHKVFFSLTRFHFLYYWQAEDSISKDKAIEIANDSKKKRRATNNSNKKIIKLNAAHTYRYAIHISTCEWVLYHRQTNPKIIKRSRSIISNKV